MLTTRGRGLPTKPDSGHAAALSGVGAGKVMSVTAIIIDTLIVMAGIYAVAPIFTKPYSQN